LLDPVRTFRTQFSTTGHKITTRSLWLDIRIILMTFPAVLFSRGVYIEGSKRSKEIV